MAYTTRGSLLSAVRRGDEIGWNEFYDTYKGLIWSRASELRLNQTEKEDLVQLVMTEFFKGSQNFKYDRSKGRFRTYLGRVIRNKAYDLMKKRKDGTVSTEIVEFDVLWESAEDRWAIEWENHLLKQAFEELKVKIEPTTYQSYHLFVVEQLPAKQVAKLLEIKANAVYQHKTRVEEMLREIVKSLDD